MVIRTISRCSALSITMAAQTLVQIQPSTPDVPSSGVYLVALDDSWHTATVQALIAQDSQMIAPLLPYSVLVMHGGTRKLRAVTVKWSWKKSNGRPSGITLTLTSMSSDNDPTQIVPGAGKLFTPIQVVNQYLTIPLGQRKAPAGAGPKIIQGQPDYPSVIQKQLGLMDIGSNVQVCLEGVVYEDYSFVGSDRLFGSLQRYEPKVHR